MDNKKDYSIIFFGSRSFVIPIVQSLRDNFNLVGIVTVPNQPSGRFLKLTPTPVKEKFENTDIPIFDNEKLDKHFIDQIKKLNPDLFVVAAYGKIIPQEILDIPRYGTMNLHPSKLPKYRGASPIQSVILNGEKETAMSYMLLDSEVDHGPIIYQKEFIISKQDTFETLGNKIFHQASKDIVLVINDFLAGKLKPKVQNHSKATFCKIIKKEDGYFEIDDLPPFDKLDRMIKAYYPWPTVWTKWKGKIVKFYPDEFVQMEGKQKTKLEDFLRGHPDFPIKKLDS